jgi:hypothetical protein
MSDPCRIIVTGSRDWDNHDAIVSALIKAMSIDNGAHRFVIVQGGANGADDIAKRWAQDRQIPCETFAADWGKHGNAAGPLRNQAMLDAGADLVLAFPIGGPATSPGTWDTIHRAAAMGIPVRIYARSIIEGTVPR